MRVAGGVAGPAAPILPPSPGRRAGLGGALPVAASRSRPSAGRAWRAGPRARATPICTPAPPRGHDAGVGARRGEPPPRGGKRPAPQAPPGRPRGPRVVEAHRRRVPRVGRDGHAARIHLPRHERVPPRPQMPEMQRSTRCASSASPACPSASSFEKGGVVGAARAFLAHEVDKGNPRKRLLERLTRCLCSSARRRTRSRSPRRCPAPETRPRRAGGSLPSPPSHSF